MTQKHHIMHGRDHAPGGADPIPNLGGGGGGGLNVGWAGPYPVNQLLFGPVWKVPLVAGSPATFNLTRMLFRLEQPGTGSTSVSVQKAPGGDVAFTSYTTVGSLTLTGGSDYEVTATAGLGTVASGDLLRIVWSSAGTNAQGYLVQLEGAPA